MDYKEVIRLIKEKFNKTFETSYDIEYNSREKIVKSNSKFNIGEKAAAFYDTGAKKIYIFSEIIDKLRLNNGDANFDQGLTFLIHATFHELEHAIQREHPEKLRKQFNYSKAMYSIESIIIMMSAVDSQILDLDYSKSHDNFLLEIDADIKGVNNAKEFVRNYGLNGVNTEYYNLMDKYNNFRIDNYDIPIMINQFLKIVNKYPGILSDKRWLNNDELVNFLMKMESLNQ